MLKSNYILIFLEKLFFFFQSFFLFFFHENLFIFFNDFFSLCRNTFFSHSKQKKKFKWRGFNFKLNSKTSCDQLKQSMTFNWWEKTFRKLIFFFIFIFFIYFSSFLVFPFS
ncbi:hypothetical protein HMI54_006940 [Coelomomyces lativittatus]|nr:hypothetical protein HMI54_006940 [Coelomomyces lativittatus]